MRSRVGGVYDSMHWDLDLYSRKHGISDFDRICSWPGVILMNECSLCCVHKL